MVDKVTKEKHPGRVAQGHKLVALMRKRKEEMLQNKHTEQSSVLSTEQPTEQPTEQSLVLSTEQSSVLSSKTLIILGIVGIGVAGIYIFNIRKTPEKQITENTQKKPKTYMYTI